MREMTAPKGVNDFYIPFSQVLIKAEEEGSRWVVYLEASNEVVDTEKEVIFCKALQKAKDYYLKNGVLSWDHQHKIQKDPKFIIGEPSDATFTDSNKTLVKGLLYKESDLAQSVWKLLQSDSSRLGSSIGGYVLGKSKVSPDGAFAKGVTAVTEVMWDETAITYKPVNDSLMGKVQVIPFEQFAKALMAGGGVNASLFTGGRALTSESVQGGVISISSNVLTTLFGDLFKAVKEGHIKNQDDLASFVTNRGFEGGVATNIIQFVIDKLPDVFRQLRR